MHVLILGGLGYTGSVLTQSLLSDNHKVTVIDNKWFGDHLKIKNKNLKKYKIDIRDYDKITFQGVDKVIHLANIANDPAVDLNPSLSWEVNVLATRYLMEKCIQYKIKHLIYAS